MSSDIESMDDPALKSALKRSLANETAPAYLQERIAGMMRDATCSSLVLRPAFWRRPLYQAAAAILVFGMVGAALAWQLRKAAPAAASGPPRAMLVALVQKHDECCSRPDHALQGIPTANLKLVARGISKQLNDPVLAADLRQDGWQFKGACICSVCESQGAHFVFEKLGRQISVFSIPAPQLGKDAKKFVFKDEIDEHMVAGFASKGRVYCLVGYCPTHELPLEEVASLLEKHQDELEMADSAVASASILHGAP